jgi:hypothetical protein
MAPLLMMAPQGHWVVPLLNLLVPQGQWVAPLLPLLLMVPMVAV